MKVEPATPEMIVRDPVTRAALPARVFTDVPDTTYWRRRILKRDVVTPDDKPRKEG